jgi:hypothetical protein
MVMETATLEFKKRKFIHSGKEYHITLVNERAIKDHWPSDAAVVIADGDCLAPVVFYKNLVVISSEINPVNNDIVLINHKEKGNYLQFYQDIEGKKYFSSRHGKMSLEGWDIIATCILVAGLPNEEIEIDGKKCLRIPVYDLKPLPPI